MRTKQDWQFETDNSKISNSRAMSILTVLFYLSCVNLVAIITAPLSRYYLDAPGFVSFRVMLAAIIIGVILGVTALTLSGIMVFSKSDVTWRPVIMIVMIGFAPVLIAIFSMGIDALSKPLIHDISTDVNDPPQYQETKNLRRAGENSTDYMRNEIAEKQLTAYPDLKPLVTGLSVDEALIEATQVVKDLQWEFINVDYGQGIIEAYDTSKLFGFIDDIIIRVRPEGSGSQIDIRSSSRVGKGDLGKNAERIFQFIRTFRT